MADPTTDAPKKPGQINIFVMMLFVALLALILACGLLALELGRYNFQSEPPPEYKSAATVAVGVQHA